jgi:hypothetical protein
MRIEVLLDGRRVAIAGVEQFGVVSAMITWVKRDPEGITAKIRAREHFDETDFVREACTLEISGMSSDTHLAWAREALRAGSEITVRVLGPGEYDAPPTR